MKLLHTAQVPAQLQNSRPFWAWQDHNNNSMLNLSHKESAATTHMSRASDLAYLRKNIIYQNGEPWVTVNGLKRMTNILIADGDCADVQIALQLLKYLDEQNNNNNKTTTTVLCANCAAKIGYHKCSGCKSSSSLRYCGRDCQRKHWPTHKPSCGTRV